MAKRKFTPRRNPMLSKIHIAQKELGMSDEDYRAMLHGVTGKQSCADLTDRQLVQVLEHLTRLGFSAKTKGRPKNMDPQKAQGHHQVSRAKQLEKIEALLTVGKRPWSYADVLAKKICKVDKIAWVTDADLYRVITALRKQAEREGWDLSGEK